MTGARSRPWLLSLGLHGLVAALVVGVLLLPGEPAPAVVHMRLVAVGSGKTGQAKPVLQGGWGPPAQSSPHALSEPTVPSWRGRAPVQTPERVPVPAPASLDELLGTLPPPPAEEAATSSPRGGWESAGGEGYEPPPLPPPRLAPPQGARWDLVLSIPGGGGYALHVEGLDSGHPELDRWLEAYLRTVSFPSSLDGRDYQLKWSLRLDTGRPQ